MPSAKGLIHKAVPLSGSTTQALDQNYSQKLGTYILKEAGLKPSEIDKLQDIPWKEYILLANKARQTLTEEGEGAEFFRGGFAPVADGINIPTGKFYSDENSVSSDVPMLICSTFHEWGMARTSQEMEDISAEKAKEMLSQRAGFRGGLGEKAPEVYDAYAKIFPDAKPIEIMTLIASNRKAVVETATAKTNENAPVYAAWFGWEPPMFNGRMRAFHCLDICFWYANTDLMLTHTGGGARPRKLSEMMSGSLLQFMKTGNPNGGGLPEWPEFTMENGETMILNDNCEVRNDPDREGRILI
jgi:para-nitrobenzyl esterase